jgi:hypothetical protein
MLAQDPHRVDDNVDAAQSRKPVLRARVAGEIDRGRVRPTGWIALPADHVVAPGSERRRDARA